MVNAHCRTNNWIIEWTIESFYVSNWTKVNTGISDFLLPFVNQKNKKKYSVSEEKLKLSEKDWSVTCNSSLPLNAVSFIKGRTSSQERQLLTFQHWGPGAVTLVPWFYSTSHVFLFSTTGSFCAFDPAAMKWLSRGRKYTVHDDGFHIPKSPSLPPPACSDIQFSLGKKMCLMARKMSQFIKCLPGKCQDPSSSL